MIKLKKLIPILLGSLPLIITLIVLPMMPDKIPAHYNSSGVVDRWGSKFELLILPIITVALVGIFITVGIFLGKRVKEGKTIEKVVDITSVFLAITFTALTLWFIIMAYNKVENIAANVKIDIMKITAIAFSILWVLLGNILPKCKQNYLVGFRTKATLSSETVWYKSHRLGGKVLFVYGVLSLVASIFIPKGWIAMIVTMSGLLVAVMVLIIYAHVIWKKEQSETADKIIIK